MHSHCVACGNTRKGDSIYQCKSCGKTWCNRCSTGLKCTNCHTSKGLFGSNIKKIGQIK